MRRGRFAGRLSGEPWIGEDGHSGPVWRAAQGGSECSSRGRPRQRELVVTLAGWLGLPRDDVTIVTGRASRDKTLAFKGIEESELRSRLTALANDQGAQGSSA